LVQNGQNVFPFAQMQTYRLTESVVNGGIAQGNNALFTRVWELLREEHQRKPFDSIVNGGIAQGNNALFTRVWELLGEEHQRKPFDSKGLLVWQRCCYL
jgi:hypothetical protein